MIYFIDFDDTIFNAKLFRKNFKKIFHKNGINEKEFEESYVPCKEGICGKTFKEYDLKKQLIDIESRHGKKKALRKDLKKFLKSIEHYIFEDFYDFTKEVTKDEIFLISFGDTSFQKGKIKNSNILKYINNYKLTNTSKANCIKEIIKKNKIQETMCFIDDRPDQIKEVQENIPEMVIYRMKKSEGRYGKIPTPKNIPEITKITDILK